MSFQRHRVPTPRRPPRQSGFTLIELLVAFAVFVGILVAVLLLFNFSYKLARDQTYVSDMQQSLRFGQQDLMRMVRMAGRGGFGRGDDLPDGLAVAVESNVAANTYIGADATTPAVVEGTDILTIRGLFNSPIYQVNPAAGEFIIDNPPSTGTIRLRDPSPQTGAPQSLQPLVDAINADITEPILLVSPLDDSIFAVVELDPDACAINAVDGSRTTDLTLAFNVVGKYSWLTPGGLGFPATLRSVAFVGILEEYRFYVRETFAIPGDTSSELVPRLSRAQFFPDSLDTPYANDDANLRVDLADNILDFQVALGIDTDETNDAEEDLANPDSDDWLYNDAGDDDTEARWDVVPASVPPRTPDLYYIRLTTLARTDRPELTYISPAIDNLEDHVLNEPDNPSGTEMERRRYRRWLMRTVVDLRNL
jgi:prepilin-type N-terminal cleavage/methylation domain-containing protein